MKINFICFFIVLIAIYELVSSKKKSKDKNPNPNNMPKKEITNRFITFKINKERWTDIDHFSRIFSQFFLNAGIKMQLVNLSDNELLGICEEGTVIDKEAIMENFEGIVESIDIAK